MTKQLTAALLVPLSEQFFISRKHPAGTSELFFLNIVISFIDLTIFVSNIVAKYHGELVIAAVLYWKSMQIDYM